MDENVKNDAKQVMLVQNADDGRLQAVTGVDQDGNIQTADPTDQNVASLLNVNTQDSALEAFFKKFMEQAQNPVHTGIFVMTENALNKLIRIDFDPEILENYRIDPSERLQTQEQRQFEPLDVTKIDLADMEKKGIRTEKGEFNRWIKATNAVIKDIRKKISLLFDWITEIKAELAKPQTPDLVSLLNDYYTQRKAGAYSQKGKISNLKEMNETYNYLRANGIYTLEDLESRLQSHRTTVDGLKTTMDSQNARMKAIRRDIPLTLADERIARAIRENNAKLVIIDPVQAFLGADVDMNRANEVRPIFRSLGDIAQATGCAIVLIGHLNKAAGTQSTYRGLGSIDITAAVRSLLFIGKLKDNPTTRVLIHEKSSLAPPGQSLAFSLGDEKGFEWIGAYDITADELLAGTDTAKTESKTAQAEMLILELLANGKKMPSAELEKAVNDRGISSRTMRTAKSRIGDRLITEKDGTAWVCYLRN